ncbi:MAG: glycosyltransferase, partial [Pseudomonadota bacterium]|nr:glycosyltransferase [Pseudomonadota bacterium]
SLQAHCSAMIRHLPDSFVCFDPPLDAPPVMPTPAEASRQFTFGYFGNPAKCGSDVIKLWADILSRVPAARLLLKYKGFGDEACRLTFEKHFAAFGVEASRLRFEGASPIADLFGTMQQVDLALDPFPFAGGLMTCLTLWMGVPVVTWPGETFASRQGLSLLTTIGVENTVAASAEDYVQIAVTLAGDPPARNLLRQRLRPAMTSSPLCDGGRAGAALQKLLRDLWRERCASPE